MNVIWPRKKTSMQFAMRSANRSYSELECQYTSLDRSSVASNIIVTFWRSLIVWKAANELVEGSN